MKPAPKEITRLINAYADEQLDSQETKVLVEALRASEDLCERLATVIVTERLLRASGMEGVTPQRVITHLKDAGVIPAVSAVTTSNRKKHKIEIHKNTGAPPRTRLSRKGAGRKQNTHKSHSLLPLFVISIIIAAIGVITYKTQTTHNTLQETRQSAEPSRPAPQPGGEKEPTLVDDKKPTPIPHPKNNTKPDNLSLTSFFPVEPPPPPPGENLSPPSGDGSTEPGFAPPPNAWLLQAEQRASHLPPASFEPEISRNQPHQPQPTLLCIKIRHGDPRNWNVTPDDLTTLLDVMHKNTGIAYGTAIRSLDELNCDPAVNPILYFTGHYHFVFSAAQRVKLRTFMLQGGMLIFNAGLGSKPFYDSARREMRLIFPELPIEQFGSDHPLYHAYYNIDLESYRSAEFKTNDTSALPRLEGITLSCRTAAVISRWGMATGWKKIEGNFATAYRPDDAIRLGINLFSYGTAVRAWAKKASYMSTFTEENLAPAGTLSIAQIKYNGGWRTRYAALPLLLHSFNQRTEVSVRLTVRTMTLTDTELFNMPLLYITGHESMRLSDAELTRLKHYLNNGGLLFAESCCGKAGFDRDFRAAMHRIFPALALQPIPLSDPIYSLPNQIKSVRVTPALSARLGSSRIPPHLESIRIDGHDVVIYSPYGLAGGWEMSQLPYACGYEGSDALKLGQNILMHAITE